MDFAKTISHVLEHIRVVELNSSRVYNLLIHTQTVSFNTGYCRIQQENVKLMHEYSKHLRLETNKTKKQRKEEGKQKRVKMERSKEGIKKICPDGIGGQLGRTVIRGRYFPKQWMNCLTDLTYTYNSSTTPGGLCWQFMSIKKCVKINNIGRFFKPWCTAVMFILSSIK